MIDLAFAALVALVVAAAIVVFVASMRDEKDEALHDRGGHVKVEKDEP